VSLVLGSVWSKTVRDQLRLLLGWGLGVAALTLLEGAVWPSVRDMPDLEEFLAGYPEAMTELFDLGAMGTGTGFFEAELYSLLLPVLFLVFAISRGSRLMAGEEENGTLETLLVTPLSTTRVLLEKAAGLAVGVVVLGVVTGASTLVVSALFDMGIGVPEALVGSLSMVLLGIEFGWLALAVGAMTGRRSAAMGLAGVAAVGGYVLYAAGLIVDEMSSWASWSPFHQALLDGPLSSTVPARFGWLLLGAVVVLAAAPPVLARRDIGIH
jgi:ABC-2 type transport system permease protein